MHTMIEIEMIGDDVGCQMSIPNGIILKCQACVNNDIDRSYNGIKLWVHK